MDAVRLCQTVEQLQTLVDAEIWRDRPDVEWAIQDRLLELMQLWNLHSVTFGHPHFLRSIYSDSMDDDDDDDDTDNWLTLDEYNQQGGLAAALQPAPDVDYSQYWDIRDEFEQHIQRFNVKGKAYTVHFQNMHQVDDLSEFMEKLFQNLLDRTQTNNDALIGFELRHPELDNPILIPFHKKTDHSAATIARFIERALQSNQDIDLDQGLVCQVTSVTPPSGSGRKRPVVLEEFLAHQRCLIQIPGDDGLCLPRALVTSIAQVDNDPQWNTIRRGSSNRNTLQERRARELMQRAQMHTHQGAWGLAQVQQFQNHLTPDYQIRVFSKATCSDMIYSGPPATKHLYLFLHENHFTVITKIQAFLRTGYYCPNCNKTFQNQESHPRGCDTTCSRCYNSPKCNATNLMLCNDCQRWFANAQCFDKHRQTSSAATTLSTCQKRKRCPTCSIEYTTRNGPHNCNMGYCGFCKKTVPKMADHRCYMSNYEPKDVETRGYIFYDFETQQVKEVAVNKYGSIFLHEPICCIVHKVCDLCWREPDMSTLCVNCGDQRKRVFQGSNLLDRFTSWLFNTQNRDCIAMAHNNKSFDGMFILESLHRTTINPPDLIFKGLSIMTLGLGGVRILDSMNFLPMALSAIPGAFNLQELKKGYFPHMFSSNAAWDYDGPLPDAYFYGPARMKQKAKDEFFKWYLQQKDNRFVFNDELLEYCNSDVDILKQGAMTFRETFVKETGLDPYTNAITISDACMKTFRMNYLQDNSIGLIPCGEYRVKDKYSQIGIQWLQWTSHTQGIRIQHALNGGEVQIRVAGHTYKADGLHAQTRTVYEFYGCPFHGCMKCFPPTTLLPIKGQLVKEAYQETLDRKHRIESAGYTVREMWYCDLKRQLKLDNVMRAFFDAHQPIQPIKGRDAFYGGRTNCVKLHHKTQPGECIEFIDVCSLYPWTLKYGVFPIGHPTIITEEFEDINQQPYQGLIKCRVLAPRGLYHPVLPVKLNDKLMFPCCYTCTLELRKDGDCPHNNDERAFWGTWVTLEVYKALEKGYSVLEISEVWDYGTNVKQYHHGDDTDAGLFTEYINAFLKMKQEASDWPKWCTTDEQKQQYLDDYKQHEGIELDPQNIKKNPALRALAKLCLNSFFGKFGQRNNMPKDHCVNEPAEFFEILSDPTKLVKWVQAFNENVIQINYVHEEGFEEALPSTNVVIAAYVTTQARLKLYSYLEQLEKKVLYFDTDSIIYIRQQNDAPVETGSYLGDMTNELEGYGTGAYIEEFVSAGPKNYAYNVKCPDGMMKRMVKIRGFTLDSVTAKRLNMKTLKRKVQAYVHNGFNEQTTVVQYKIERSREGHVFTEAKCKTYSVVIDKRWCDHDYYTYPYGY